jgi:hypothetical protein
MMMGINQIYKIYTVPVVEIITHMGKQLFIF